MRQNYAGSLVQLRSTQERTKRWIHDSDMVHSFNDKILMARCSIRMRCRQFGAVMLAFVIFSSWSPFRKGSSVQNKCYLLATLIYKIQTQYLVDEERGTEAAIYVSTKNNDEFFVGRNAKLCLAIFESNYFEVVDSLFQRFSKALNECHCLSSQRKNKF